MALKKIIKPKKKVAPKTETYRYPEATTPLRPEVGTQAQFKKRKPPKTYRYDSSLSPALEWDSQNPTREQGEQQLAKMEEELVALRSLLLSFPNASIGNPVQDKDRFPLKIRGNDREGIQGGMTDEMVEQIKKRMFALEEAIRTLKNISKPFLNWSGKAERISFDVPTLPLFVHERLSTKAIIETLKSHKRDTQMDFLDLFGDPQHSVSDQVLKAYEYSDKWVNRMVLGDSLVVMNSLLQYEGLGGQVQMIYIDPPYGVKFGSNFQPFVRQRDVSHNDDEDLTREPEMVKAYRDTWELGLHSYLTYMRDRLLLARDLLSATGSVFVQIGEENLHHVRELMDEIFGVENSCRLIPYITTSFQADKILPNTTNYLLWYAKDKERVKAQSLFRQKALGDDEAGEYKWIRLVDGSFRSMTETEQSGIDALPKGARPFRYGPLTSQGYSEKGSKPFTYKGKTYSPGNNQHWKVKTEGLQYLADKSLLLPRENSLSYFMFLDEFPVSPITNIWTDTKWGFDAGDKAYVVQTNAKVVQRCLLMTTSPGDLVLDPTCGSGTTAYVAEQWGRRWITIDTSRVPLALAKQRLLTATFPYYELQDESRGPSGGFCYKSEGESKNSKNIGPGIVQHLTLGNIANEEPSKPEVLVDRPETVNRITHVTGPFCVEATIPTPIDITEDTEEQKSGDEYGTFVDRMLEILRRSPVLHIGGGKTVALKNVRLPAKTLSLSAEALVAATAPGQKPTLHEAVMEADERNGKALALSQKAVAFLFGPENGAVSERSVYEAAREAYAKSYTHLYVIGFAIQPHARELIEKCEQTVGIPATYVQATPDLMMGDLLKNMRSSQIFSVCGLPEVKVRRKGTKEAKYQVELLGLDVFDPITMEVDHRKGDDVPAWLLDTDYNGLVFHVTQAFFPRTSAWDGLKRALKATYEETVWDHLAGTKSADFEAGEHKQIAVKVIDDRGNELLVVKSLKEAEE